jgi:hypothetical protein
MSAETYGDLLTTRWNELKGWRESTFFLYYNQKLLKE